MRTDLEPHSPIQGECTQLSVVQKSYPLLSLWKSPLSLTELKILDTYLARIDSHHPEQRWVRFHKGELETILGVKQLRVQDLKERLRNLCIVVQIDDPEVPRGFRAVALFEQMLCDQDENGQWQVDIQCSTAAMKYIFNIDEIGYLGYRLQAILHLRSRYSYVLLLYVERNSFRTQWEVPVDELRKILRCNDDPCYKDFRRFNDRVLKRAHQEITEKTDCRFSYVTVRAGRRIQAIRFLYEGSSVLTLYDSETIVKTEEYPQGNTKRSKIIEFLSSACSRNGVPEFSDMEIEHLLEILRVISPDIMPQHTPGKDTTLSMYHYLAEKYTAMNRMDEQKNIKHRFAYLEHILKQDAGLI